MKILDYFPHVVVVTLLVLAGVFKSPAFAYASVLALVALLMSNALDFYRAIHEKKNAPVEAALRQKLIDMEARVTTIEYGIRQRGF
jgi:hypothetical protein